MLYFSANGREQNEDPYYVHLYRVNFDGSGLRLLNPGDFDHNVSMNDNKRYFVDNYSRVNTAPKSALYNAEGGKRLWILKLQIFLRCLLQVINSLNI